MIDNEFHFVLLKCFQASNNRIIKEISKIGLLAGQPKILEFLLENDGSTANDICTGCSLDKSTVVGILTRMEKMDLIYRVENPKDKRSSFVFMTKLGEQKAQKVKNICDDIDSLALTHLDETKINELITILKQITINLA